MLLQIKAQDIEENPYWDKRVCPITRALRRRNLPYYHLGMSIKDESGRTVVSWDSPGLRALTRRVERMYVREEARIDFEVEIKELG